MIISILLFPATLLAQESCRSTLLGAVNNMRSLYDAERLHLTYVIKSEVTATGAIEEARVDLFITENEASVISEDNSIYQSNNINLVLYKERKLAYLTNSDINFKKAQFKNIGIIQDSLLSMSPIVDCESGCVDDKKNINFEKITLKLSEAVANRLGISSVTYVIDPDRLTISRMMATYRKGNLLSYVEMIIEGIETEYKGKIIDNKRVEMVLANPDRISEYFKEYTVIDKRNEEPAE